MTKEKGNELKLRALGIGDYYDFYLLLIEMHCKTIMLWAQRERLKIHAKSK